MRRGTLAFLLVAAWAPPTLAQEASPPAAEPLWLETWAGARANDVLTGWTDLNELAATAGRKSRALAKASEEANKVWAGQLAAASRASGGALRASSRISPDIVARVQAILAANATEAERLATLSRGLRSNPGAGGFGSWLGKWGTPLAAMAGAAGSLWEADWIGASQDLLNGAGSMKATALGAAAGLSLGGPWGALIGGIAGNVVYTFTFNPIVSGLADRVVDAQSGPDAEDRWAAAQVRTAAWTAQAGELAEASRELLQSAGPPGVGEQLPSLEAELGELGATLDRLTERRLRLCAADRPALEPLLGRFRSACADVSAGLDRARALEQRTCSTLDRMRASPEDAARIREEHRAGGGSASPPGTAVRESLAAAERAHDQVRQVDAGLERSRREADELSHEFVVLRRRATQLGDRAESSIAGVRQVEERLVKAEALRGQALVLLERASLAAGRHVSQRALGNEPLVALGRVNAERERLPSTTDFSAARQRLTGLRGRLDFVLSEAGELIAGVGPAAEAAAACAPASVDLADLEPSIALARARAEEFDQLVAGAAPCRAEIERERGRPADALPAPDPAGTPRIGAGPETAGGPGAQTWIAVGDAASAGEPGAAAALVRGALATCDFSLAEQFLEQVQPPRCARPSRPRSTRGARNVPPWPRTSRRSRWRPRTPRPPPSARRAPLPSPQRTARATRRRCEPSWPGRWTRCAPRCRASVSRWTGRSEARSERRPTRMRVGGGWATWPEAWRVRWRLERNRPPPARPPPARAPAAPAAQPGAARSSKQNLSMCRSMESRDRNGVILHWVIESRSGGSTTWGFVCQPRGATTRPSGSGVYGPFDTPDQALGRVPANCR